jgi:hypothetical protein
MKKDRSTESAKLLSIVRLFVFMKHYFFYNGFWVFGKGDDFMLFTY